MKTKQVGARASQIQEDHLLIHAHVRGIKRRATMAQIAFDMGMESLEAQLPENWEELLAELKAKGVGR
jgi:hypothetical protein